MTVQIKARIERVLPAEGQYRVDVDIIDVVDITFEVLVFRQLDDGFSHVASVFDMETYPTVPDVNRAFYRGRGVKATFGSIREATDFELITRDRLKILAVAWNSIVQDFTGVEILDVDSVLTS